MNILMRFMNKFTQSERLKIMILGVLLVMILIYQIFLMHIGVVFTDEPWQIMNSMNYREVPQALLSHAIGNCWGSFLGFSISSFRWLSFILHNLCIVILLVPLYLETRNKSLVLAVGVILTLFHCVSLWGWDAPNTLFWSASLVSFYLFIKKFKYKWLIICGVCNALFTLCRIPSLLNVPIELLVFGLMLCYKFINTKQFLKYTGILLGIYCSTLFVVICLLFGNPIDYLNALTSTGSEEHNIVKLILSYISSGKLILCYIFSVLGLLLVLYLFDCRYSKFTFVISVIVFIIFFRFNLDSYYFQRNFILDAMVIITICFAIIHSRLRNDKAERYKIFVFVMLLVMYALIPAAGSNTGLLKVANVSMLPMLLILIRKYDKLYNAKLYLLAVFFAGGIYTLINTASSVYEHVGWRYVDTKLELPAVSVYTTKENAAFILEVKQQADIELNNNENIMFVGDAHRFLFEYLYGERAPYTRNDFWLSLNSEAYANPTQEYIKEKEKTVIFMLKNQDTEQAMNNMTLTDKKIEELGFSIVSDSKKFRVYKKH